jgi:hypothetical protein
MSVLNTARDSFLRYVATNAVGFLSSFRDDQGAFLKEVHNIVRLKVLHRLRTVAGVLRALETYVVGQATMITDYATARHGEEPISMVPTESTVQ